LPKLQSYRPANTVTEVFDTFDNVDKLIIDYKESKSFYEELLERIEDLEQVIKRETEEKLLSKTEDKQFGQTTIGFGNSLSSASSTGQNGTEKSEVENISVVKIKKKEKTTNHR